MRGYMSTYRALWMIRWNMPILVNILNILNRYVEVLILSLELRLIWQNGEMLMKEEWTVRGLIPLASLNAVI